MCYESARVAHSNSKYIRISIFASSNYSSVPLNLRFTKVSEAQSSNDDIMDKGEGLMHRREEILFSLAQVRVRVVLLYAVIVLL